MSVCSKCARETSDLQMKICYPCWKAQDTPVEPNLECQYQDGQGDDFWSVLNSQDWKLLDQAWTKRHGGGAEVLSCAQCEKKYAYKRSLQRHMKTLHDQLNPPAFDCELCQKTFKYKSSLTRHFKICKGLLAQKQKV